jgi:heme/copper-type cytochrome/quinol oxidase subunit 3
MKYSEEFETCIMLVASLLVIVSRCVNVRRGKWQGKPLYFFLTIVLGLIFGFMVEV